MNGFTNPYCREAQVMYIYHYQMLLSIDDNPAKHRELIAKTATTYKVDDMVIYSVLRMYGLLWDEQTVHQINTFGNHAFDPKFDDRWELFEKHNKRPHLTNHDIDLSQHKQLPKARLFKKGRTEELLKTITTANTIWDEARLRHLRMNYQTRREPIELVKPFIEPDKPRYKWNKK